VPGALLLLLLLVVVVQVGSEDFDIRLFKEEDVVLEIPEADCLVGLQHLAGAR
jgi:hypothetical protein